MKIKREPKIVLIAILAIICTLSVVMSACNSLQNNGSQPNAYDKNSNPQYADGDVPMTDLAASYKGKATDSDGNLLAPFDVVYPEHFSSGKYEFDKNAALLKFAKGYDGSVTQDLKDCGFVSVEKVSTNADGSMWYRAAITEGGDITVAVKKARSIKKILMADYDYIYTRESVAQSSSETSSSDEQATTEDLINDVLGNVQVKNQWYLTSCSIQKAWRFLQSNDIPAGGLPSVTVAVIDTGVDYTHPDLKANMWVNDGEIPGNGIDDDGDGYIDDVYGCSTVSDERFHSGDPMDDHGHGTHVAGIIAAANNLVGTVGVAYNAKIMAIKAGQASGVFLQSDIAEAIIYAYTHGADVINMSFGGSACSIAVQEALQQAYTTSSLVAAAGNDGSPNEETPAYQALPNYPAALSYVVGVMSVNAFDIESSFTNWDVKEFNSIEYEVYAPGEAMLSTLPNGRYGKLNGTSMATPVVSGIAALLRSYYTDRDMYSSKFISAQLSATSNDSASCFYPEKHGPHNLPMIVNAYDALTKLPKPDVNLYGYYIFDDNKVSDKNNGDGVVDAGETLNIGTVLRNRWGMSQNTVVTINALSSSDVANPYVEIVTSNTNFDGIGTYSTKDNLTRDTNSAITGVNNPLVVKIADNCPNDYIVTLNVEISFNNGLDETDLTNYMCKGKISFSVRNGVVLPSQITEDMTLTKDNYYIIQNSTVIKEGVTVTAEAGTKIQFWSNDPTDPYADQYMAYLQVEGKFVTNGTLEEPVELFPSDLMDGYVVELWESINGIIELNYTNITNASLDVSFADHCKFTQNYADQYDKRYFEDGGKIKSTRIMFSKSISYNFFYGCFKISNATNCVLYALGGCPYSDFNPKLIGNYSSCTFVDCDFSTYPYDYSFENCVFMGNKTVAQGSEQIGSSITLQNEYYIQYFKRFGGDEYDGKSYFMFASDLIAEIDDLRGFALFLGGDICCLETENEYEYVMNNYNLYGHLGLICGSDTWMNGEPVGDFIKDKLPEESEGTLLYKDGAINDFGICKNDKHCYTLLELPGSLTKWTQDYLTERFKAYLKWTNYRSVTNIKNCAVLNNYNDTSFALKILAPTIETGSNSDNYLNGNSVAYNYWGTTDIKLINRQVVDYDQFKNLIDLLVDPILTVAPSNTFPFVVDAYVINGNGERVRTVSNETCTFVVEFNRDMDTSLPLRVRFGSSIPYAEYEIFGEYVTPRKWQGTYTLNTTIENGNQYFNIDNARAVDDHFLRLYETLGRFSFEIDTTVAQAMSMQGEATETGVKLTWQQDDFDTLLGYNVYRSDKEDGLYTRLNSYVLSADETSFFDNTIEPGKMYYYNFTVVKTNMEESTPSGKIVIRAMDTMAPDIYHSPVHTTYTGKNLVVSATITDNLQITEARLFFRIKDGEWKSVAMYNNNSRYYGIVSAEYITTEGLEYYIDAFDGVSHTYNGSADNPYFVTVKVAVELNSMGDVDGDGVITNKDALMLLQAANDLLNLTEEQFMRADLNGDGELSAVEAMKILQYVSGKITSVLD